MDQGVVTDLEIQALVDNSDRRLSGEERRQLTAIITHDQILKKDMATLSGERSFCRHGGKKADSNYIDPHLVLVDVALLDVGEVHPRIRP